MILFVDQAGFYLLPCVVRTSAFSKHALRQIAGKLLIIWDGSPIHHAKFVKEFLADGAAARVQLEQLPGYAPQLTLTREFGSISSTRSSETSAA